MEYFKSQKIGDDLYEVWIDGVKQDELYDLAGLGELYEKLWRKDEEECT